MGHSLTKQVVKVQVASALLLSLVACGHERGDRSFTRADGGSNHHVETALANQGDLSMFYQAMLTTGVANELNENTEYTIFAPTNAAFKEIRPRVYPCFYAAQCRGQVAAVLRNHIIPRNESVARFSKWGGDIPTLGNRTLDVEEPYKGSYTVEGYRVLYQNSMNEANFHKGNKVSIYAIDSVIVSNQDLAPFRTQPFVSMPNTITEKTVTTYRTPTTSVVYGTGPVPGGNPVSMPVHITPNTYYDGISETTTVTQTTTE